MRLWRRKAWFAAVAGGVFGLAALILLSLPTHFTANGSVIVGETEGLVRPAEPVDIESQAALIRSPRLIRTVLARPGVAEAVRRDCERDRNVVTSLMRQAVPCATGVDGAIAYAARQFVIQPVGPSRVVEVGYTGTSPETAQGMANFLIQAFLDEPRPPVLADRERAVAKLRQDVAAIESAVKEDEGKLAIARRQQTAPAAVDRPAGAVPSSSTPSSSGPSSSGPRLSVAQREMAEAALKMKAYQRGIGGPPDVRAGLDAKPIEEVETQLESVVTRIAAEPSGSPLLRSLSAQREELRLRVERDAIPGYRAANRAYTAAAGQFSTPTLQMVADIRPDPTEPLPDPAVIERTLDLKRQLYVDAYRRASAVEAEPLPAVPVNKLVNLAERPALPNEHLAPAWWGSALLALMCGSIAALWRDTSDRTIRSAAAIEDGHKLEVLAQIPRVVPAGSLTARLATTAMLPLIDTLAAAQASPLVQDALRSLHARLIWSGPAPPGNGSERRRTFLITSAAQGEGKSFTTLALAQLIASSGRRVLAVECDLRRPTFTVALNLATGPGLGDVLRGFTAPQEAVARTSIMTLDAIPAGPPCTDSTELLMGPRMAELLAWAADYDVVLLDTPPADVLMDARVLAKLVDGVLVVTRWGRSKLLDLGATVDGMQASGGLICGVAVTMVEMRQHSLFDARPMPTRAYMAEA